MLGHDTAGRAEAGHLAVILAGDLVEVRRVEHTVDQRLELVLPLARRGVFVETVVGELEIEPWPVRAREAGIHAAFDRAERQDRVAIDQLARLGAPLATTFLAQAGNVPIAREVCDRMPVVLFVLAHRLERRRTLVDMLAPGQFTTRRMAGTVVQGERALSHRRCVPCRTTRRRCDARRHPATAASARIRRSARSSPARAA